VADSQPLDYELEPPETELRHFALLLNAGYPASAALELACVPGIDLELALALRRRGCPSNLAYEILR